VTTRLTLRVAPGAARSGVVGRHGAAWKVRVVAAPEDGKANAAVVKLVAETLGLPVRDVAIVSGQAARDKTVELNGIDAAEAERRMMRACAGKEAA
jgi:hypothetical protein